MDQFRGSGSEAVGIDWIPNRFPPPHVENAWKRGGYFLEKIETGLEIYQYIVC